MARKRKKNEFNAGELNLTAMIDVAFQLLSFFIITVRPMTVYTHLDVYRPSSPTASKPNETPPKMIRIQVFHDALLMNDRTVDFESLRGILRKLAALSTTQTVMILCARDSEHEQLIKVLDVCADAGLSQLSVLTMQ